MTEVLAVDVHAGDVDGAQRDPAWWSSVAGTHRLAWLVMRRDRVRMALWFAALAALMAVSVASIVGLYSTPAQLEAYARTVRGNTALMVQAGPGYGLADPTVGAVVMNETSLWMCIAVAVMSMFMVVRHTRTEEELERGDLVRAAPVGRHAPLVAALIGVAVANMLVASGAVISLLVYGLALSGSVAFGAALVGVGFVFAGIGALAAQVSNGSRGALAMSAAVLGVSFALRAIGDVGNGVLSWVSPLGWAQAVRAFADERWWVLALPLAACAGLIATAFALQDRRDHGSGLLAQRSGRPTASRYLLGPVALALRLQRGALFGWATGLAVLAFFYGIVADQAEAIFDDNPELADYFAQLGVGSVTDAFMSTALLIIALFATGFTVSSVLRLRSEEAAARADQILATSVGRSRWAMSHLLVALSGTGLLALIAGAAMGVGAGLVLGDVAQVARLSLAGLVMAPAMWVVAGASFAMYGIHERLAFASWALVAWTFVAGIFGGVLHLPQWALDLSPFSHVPALPAASMSWPPLVALVIVASALLAVGHLALSHRDIT